MSAPTGPEVVAAVHGGLLGAMLILGLLALLVGNTYRERALLTHSLAIACAVTADILGSLPDRRFASCLTIVLLALAAQQLRPLTGHVGALRRRKAWITHASVLIAALAIPAFWFRTPAQLAALAAWCALAAWVAVRAYDQSRPWIAWVVAGSLALLVSVGLLALDVLEPNGLPFAAALCVWSLALYLAGVWRSRIFGETAARAEAERLRDPLTGLFKWTAVAQRIEVARVLMKRFHHTSTVMLVHLEHVDRMAEIGGPDAAEAAVLEAAARLRHVIGQADIAARASAQSFVVFAEGSAPDVASGAIASRILASGLREPLRAIPGELAYFRIAMCELPTDEVPLEFLVKGLAARVELDAARRRERRIRVVPSNELSLATTMLVDA